MKRQRTKGWDTMGDTTIHIPQQIHIEYTIRNRLRTKELLELLNTTMLQNEPESGNPNRLLGLLADQADLLDQTVEHAMQDRETAQLRVG
jgi:hypothetical protein